MVLCCELLNGNLGPANNLYFLPVCASAVFLRGSRGNHYSNNESFGGGRIVVQCEAFFSFLNFVQDDQCKLCVKGQELNVLWVTDKQVIFKVFSRMSATPV